jgi:hypothetical protein
MIAAKSAAVSPVAVKLIPIALSARVFPRNARPRLFAAVAASVPTT